MKVSRVVMFVLIYLLIVYFPTMFWSSMHDHGALPSLLKLHGIFDSVFKFPIIN